jgi:hypothetical protein
MVSVFFESGERFFENYVQYDRFTTNFMNQLQKNHLTILNVEIEVDGLSPTIKSAVSSQERNGYRSKQLSYVREFSIGTRRLFNHESGDVFLMDQLDYIHTFPYHYFTFWEYENGQLISRHKSSLGRIYFDNDWNNGMDIPGFVVVTLDTPSIKNYYADEKSKYNPHRIYSWKATEYGIRSVKDIINY